MMNFLAFMVNILYLIEIETVFGCHFLLQSIISITTILMFICSVLSYYTEKQC